MEIKHNSKLTKRAQELRKNATPQEQHLWYDFLHRYAPRFRRQVTIDRFIVDFYCASAKLVIELDGSQHYEQQDLDYDAERAAILSGFGLHQRAGRPSFPQRLRVYRLRCKGGTP